MVFTLQIIYLYIITWGIVILQELRGMRKGSLGTIGFGALQLVALIKLE